MNAVTPIETHPQPSATCIDAVLSSLAFRYRDAADSLLDLKLDTGRKTNPGACIQTYFWLVDRLPAAKQELRQIRLWLEELIEIEALGANKERFAQRTIALEGDSLEDYCSAVMRDFRRLTTRAPSDTPFDLELRFAFRN